MRELKPLRSPAAAFVGAPGVLPRMRSSVGALALLAAALVAQAKDAPPAAEDPALEKRTLAVASELRCLVCQNQTIADSDAGLAVDLRNQVRQMLRDGKTEKQITEFMTQRYGDFVLYRPPVNGSTALLWFGPPALLVLGALGLWLVLRQRNRLPADQFEPDEADAADPAAVGPATAAPAAHPRAPSP
jgi:cytochrome c-type biogenesis protein CcmH